MKRIAMLLLLIACGGKEKPPPTSPADQAAADEKAMTAGFGMDDAGAREGGAAAADDHPASDGPSGTEDGAKKLLAQFVAPDADHAALSKSLRPTTADFKSLFDGESAPKAEAAYAKEWDSGKMVIKPNDPKQSDIKLFGATGSELTAGAGNAKEFPGGYKKIAKHLAPTVTFYAFKFVAPGKDKGMAFDGLAYVNGHWVIAPKPWRVLDEKGGGAPDKGGDEPPKKKKPKKK